MRSRPDIGQQAPRFALAALDPRNDDSSGQARWALDDHLGGDRAVVLIFHRHIH